MRIGNIAAALFGRHGRLLALCGLSLLLHLLVIAWLDTRISAPLPRIGNAALAVRLAGLAPPAPAAPAAPAQLASTAPATRPAAAAEPSPVAAANAPPAPAPVQASAEAVPAPAPAAVAQPAGGGVAAVEMPSRYRVTVPPSATLRYALRGADGAGEALLDWQTDGVNYRLALDGVTGAIDSEGSTDDAGIAPLRARYRLGAGSAAIAFARERGAIVLESLGRSVQDTPGSQDGATLLMQLAGIGLADPDQLQDMVDIYVGRLDGAAVERFQVLGKETVDTPLGAMETLHLARTGAARLEVWLAPEQGWLPVQLRATAPDGSVRTQVVKEIKR